MECPFVDRTFTPDPEFNEPKDYATVEGNLYRYYIHHDGFGKEYPCQFCKLIGRKRDIFECLNESEWKRCFHYSSNITKLRKERP